LPFSNFSPDTIHTAESLEEINAPPEVFSFELQHCISQFPAEQQPLSQQFWQLPAEQFSPEQLQLTHTQSVQQHDFTSLYELLYINAIERTASAIALKKIFVFI
jgi:hypothetical protein